MKKFFIISFLLLLTIIFSFQIQISYAEKTVERIEYDVDGSRITYYTDGTRNIEVGLSQNILLSSNVASWTVTIPNYQPSLTYWLEIIKVLTAITIDLIVIREHLYLKDKKKPSYVSFTTK